MSDKVDVDRMSLHVQRIPAGSREPVSDSQGFIVGGFRSGNQIGSQCPDRILQMIRKLQKGLRSSIIPGIIKAFTGTDQSAQTGVSGEIQRSSCSIGIAILQISGNKNFRRIGKIGDQLTARLSVVSQGS